MTSTDCLVIGGGLIGMLTARELAAAGLDVTIIEKGRMGGESTWAGGGILSPLYPWRYGDAVTALASWGQQQYPLLVEELRETTGIDPQWEPCGLLMLDLEEAPQALRWARLHGQVLLEISGDEAAGLEAGLGFRPYGALWMPQVAHVRNPRLIRALRASLERQGVHLREGEAVVELLHQGGRIGGARTREGSIASRLVVIASGAWSSSLLGGMGLETGIGPVRGQMLLFAARPGVVRRIVMHEGHYLIPRRDGHVLAGSTVEYVGFDKSTTKAAYHELFAAALHIAPALTDFPVVAHWAGLRPGNREGQPLVGAVPGVEGLFINSGHFRNGVVLGLGSARLLAEIMQDQPETIVDPAPYRVMRDHAFT